ncbi:TolB-like translocation protein [Mangrovibacterium lignilyticum]|uniref:PD40 domain-containing protein n=1 Tax=Mangrovibacterium lignilyticum TaxID=2668052 RepID=UPI0013D422B6|nr:PD40 domain-containing protein [Mangrovibacterium lignilyticum]
MDDHGSRNLQGLVSVLLGVLALFSSQYIRAQVVNGKDYSSLSGVYHTFDMAGDDVFGQQFPSENFTYIDDVTGTKVNALTTSRHNNSKMYQTHPQWTADGKYVVITSDRTSTKDKRDRQAYAISMDSFEITQITTGNRGSDLHLGWHTNSAYLFRGNRLVQLKLDELLADSNKGTVGQPEDYEVELAVVPDSIRPSGLGLDAKENRVFFSRGLGKEKSEIYCVDFESGKTTKVLEVPFRIGHLQSNPFITGEVMYCWETGGDSPQRMWYMTVDADGNVTNKPIYNEHENDWVTHEVFMGPDHILFHLMGHLDRLQTNQTGLYSLNIRTNEPTFHGQTNKGGYWHCNATPDRKWIVSDTFDGRLYRINAEDNNDVVLLTQGHRGISVSPFTSEAHLHPSVSPDGKWVLINSSRFTDSDVLLLPLFPGK